MNIVHFYELPRAAQERFIGSLKGSGLPAPILRRPARPLAPGAWLGLALAALVVLVGSLAVGYGDLGSSAAREGLGYGVADAVCIGVAALGLLRASAIRREHDASPFPRGVYVFPVGLIDARRPAMRVHPIEELRGVFGPDVRGLTLDFGASTFAFPVHDAATADAAKALLDQARASVVEAAGARESLRPKALAALDPLQGYANPLASSDRLKPARPAWDTFGWALAAAAGLVLAPPLWLVRNARSDDAIFEHARGADDVASYRAYLDRGIRHMDEVTAEWLPRALLAEAKKVGTVEAVDEFLKAHPATKVTGEAREARRQVLLRELDVASKAGSLAALDEFTRRRPDAQLEVEVSSARHAVFEAALLRYAAEAADKTVAFPFVQQLLAWSEKHGPRVELRFRVPSAKSLEKADGAVGKSSQFKGVVSLPSRYFDAAGAKPVFDALASALETRLGASIPRELLTFAWGAPLTDSDPVLTLPITAPTLILDLGAAFSGSVQSSAKPPRGVYVGLELEFDAAFRLPDATKPIRVRLAGWHLPTLGLAKDSDKPEAVIYRDMLEQAAAPFQRKLLGTFFRSP